MTRISSPPHSSIIVPVHTTYDPLPANNNLPYHTEFDAKILIQELEEHINDLAQLSGTFGPKMNQILRWSWVVDLLYPDRTKLNLPHLGNNDRFSCVITRIHQKPVQRSDTNPLLHWLYAVSLEFFQPSASSRGVTLQLTPEQTSQSDPGPVPPQMIVEIRSGQAEPSIQLTIYHGGPFNERITLSRPLVEVKPQTTTVYGKPVAMRPDGTKSYPMKENDCYEDRLRNIFDDIYPRANSIWRIAVKKFSNETGKDEERFLEGLVQACKAEDDAHYLSNAQDIRCRELVNRFPLEAKEFLGDKVGKPNGPFSRGAQVNDARE